MNNEKTEIEQAEEELRLAMLQSDISKLDKLIDDDLLFVGPDGNIYSKKDDLDLHRSGEERITRLEIVEQRIHLRPYVATVSVLAVMSGLFKGQAFEGRFRYLRVWNRIHDGWRVVAGSVAALVEA
jgi:ketosteroid isomerase-like protein